MEVAEGAYYEVNSEWVVILPWWLVKEATLALETNMQLGSAVAMAASAPLLVAASAAPGVAGGTVTTSGLASIGGVLGAGMAMGVVIISAAPAVLGVAGIRNSARRAGDDQQTMNVTTGAAVVGAVEGMAGVAFTIIGSSITSTLAAYGGGSLAAGGWGMAGGLIMAASMPLTCAAVVGGTAFAVKQMWVNDEYCKAMRKWKEMGGRMGGGDSAAH